MMITVVVALQPCFLFAMYNTGLQAALAIEVGASPLDTWQTELFYALGFQFNSADHIGNFLYGMLYFVPIWVVTLAAGGLLEVLFAIVRDHRRLPGFKLAYSTNASSDDSTLAGRYRDRLWYRHR
jgi:Na+-transporting NADH:ubiquinone oxidoreductase subunit B